MTQSSSSNNNAENNSSNNNILQILFTEIVKNSKKKAEYDLLRNLYNKLNLIDNILP